MPTPTPSGSLLGAIRVAVQSNDTVWAMIPGGIFTNESPANDAFPLVTLRWPGTAFEHQTITKDESGKPQRNWLETSVVELWVDCLHAEEGEPVMRAIIAALGLEPLPFSPGITVSVLPTNMRLHPDVIRGRSGGKQYSFCVDLQCRLSVTISYTPPA